jgi:hypothetical protein
MPQATPFDLKRTPAGSKTVRQSKSSLPHHIYKSVSLFLTRRPPALGPILRRFSPEHTEFVDTLPGCQHARRRGGGPGGASPGAFAARFIDA